MDPVRIVVTSIDRNTGAGEASAFVRVIDWTRQRLMMQSPVRESCYRLRDLNPRGGQRGARGVSIYQDRVVIANPERLFVFDADWKLRGEITHPWFSEIHDILAEKEGIWVTCAGADLLAQMDWQGRPVRKWEWRRDRRLAEALGFGYLPPMNGNRDYRDPLVTWSEAQGLAHLNAVTRCPYGLLLSFGRLLSPAAYRRRRLVSLWRKWMLTMGLEELRMQSEASQLETRLRTSRVRKTPPADRARWAIVLLDDKGVSRILKRKRGLGPPSHNVILAGDELIYNDSGGGKVVTTTVTGVRPDRTALVPGSPSFPRGLAMLNEHTALVGSQFPPAVYEIDLRSGRVNKGFSWTGGKHETVYNVAVLPANIADPPARLDFGAYGGSRQNRVAA